MVKKILNNKLLLSFLLCLLTGTLIVVPKIIFNGNGMFFLGGNGDFESQQIAFNKVINYSLKNGSYLWTWFNDLGSNFIGTFSFYNLFSPFNIIAYIFPANWFEYLIGPILILKYGITGLTSFLYLQRYTKNKNYAVIGSLLYSFSGFQLTNMFFYHFHDVVAFFPLLLYSLDNLVYHNKKGRFVLFVALGAFTNWFFMISEIIFIILYYIIKIITKSYKFNFKILISILFEGLLGLGIAAVVLVPTFLFTIGNPRINNDWTIFNALIYNKSIYHELIRSLLFPNNIMSIRQFITERNYCSTELYLPLCGCILTFIYLIKQPKNWKSILFIISIIFMFIPILNSAFTLFAGEYYSSRWYFMPSLIMSLMSINTLENKFNLKYINYIFIWLILFFICYLLCFNKVENIIFDVQSTMLIIAIAIINLFILKKLLLLNQNKQIKIFLVLIIAFSVFWGNYTIYKYNLKSLSHSYFKQDLNANEIISFDKNIRINTYSCLKNLGFFLRQTSVDNFNSNIEKSAFNFYYSLGYERKQMSVVDAKNKRLNDFLGVKNIIVCKEEDLSKYGYKMEYKKAGYTIYSNPDYKDFGFYVDMYISKTKFNKLSQNEKIEVLNNTIVLDNKQINKYKELYDNVKIEKYNINNFKFINNGFKVQINSDKETLAIFTFPYEKGWIATINGKEANIENVDNGLIAIKVNNGENKIIFKYFTPGLKIGTIISILSFIVYLLYFLVIRKGEKNEV